MTSIRHAFGFLLLLVVAVGCSGGAATTSSSSSETSGSSDVDLSTTVGDGQPNAMPLELDAAVGYADSLKRALSAFEKQRRETKSLLESATNNTLSTLRDSSTTTQLRSATTQWRDRWDQVHAQTGDLWLAIANVSSKASAYFTHLERQTSRINDASLRDAERIRNERLQTKWRDSVQVAIENVRDLQNNLQKGNDLYITMMNASLRGNFGDNMGRLEDLSRTSLSLLSALGNLTETGTAVVGGREVARSATDASASDTE